MMEECKNENEDIKEAVDQLTKMSADEYERELYEIRERSRLTYNTEMNEAKRRGLEEGRKEWKKQGIKEGIKQGEKESKVAIAKKLLAKNMSTAEIAEITELTEEEVNHLKI